MNPAVCPIKFHGLAVARCIVRIPEMSRRSRKRRHADGGGWLGKAAICLIILGVVAAGVLYAMVRSYLHSDAFRRFLSAEASGMAGVTGEFTPFRWDGLAVDTSAFDAVGTGLVKGMRIEGLHAEVGVGGIRRGVWEIQGSRVQRLDVTLDARAGEAKLPPPQARNDSAAVAKSKGWLPTDIELEGVDVRDVSVKAMLDQGLLSASGMRVKVEPAGAKASYRMEIADGTMRLPFGFLPEIRLDRAKLRWQNGCVFLNSVSASVWKDGSMEASGEWDGAAGQYTLAGDVSGVKCEDLLREDWAKRFIGDVVSDFSIGNQGGQASAHGKLKVLNGTLTALPVLDTLAAYADTRRFRVLSLSEARTEWNWKKGEIFLSDLVLASEGLARLEGSIFIRGQEIDGTFRLGLAPGTLAKIPGAETDVFSPGQRGLLWAPLRITGTLDDPKEDLSDRLVAAAGLRMFDVIPETGEKVIKFSRSLLGDAPAKTLDTGAKIIEEGAGLVEGVGGAIDGFFGKSRKDEPKPAPEPERK